MIIAAVIHFGWLDKESGDVSTPQCTHQQGREPVPIPEQRTKRVYTHPEYLPVR